MSRARNKNLPFWVNIPASLNRALPSRKCSIKALATYANLQELKLITIFFRYRQLVCTYDKGSFRGHIISSPWLNYDFLHNIKKSSWSIVRKKSHAKRITSLQKASLLLIIIIQNELWKSFLYSLILGIKNFKIYT